VIKDWRKHTENRHYVHLKVTSNQSAFNPSKSLPHSWFYLIIVGKPVFLSLYNHLVGTCECATMNPALACKQLQGPETKTSLSLIRVGITGQVMAFDPKADLDLGT